METLAARPFPDGKANVAHQRRLPAGQPVAGQTHQNAVGGKRGDLGIGGNFRTAVDQIVAEEAVGAIVGLDLLQIPAVHGVAHGVAHGHAQQAALKCTVSGIHTVSSFHFG